MKLKILGGVVAALVVLGVIGVLVEDPEESEPASDETAEEEPQDTPETEEESDSEEGTEQPNIPDQAIRVTEDFIMEEEMVNDAHIDVNDEVVIALQIGQATSDEAAKEFLENTTRFLATQVAGDHDGIDGPSGDDLGELWDHYTLTVMAGPTADDVRVQGAKVPSSPRITW